MRNNNNPYTIVAVNMDLETLEKLDEIRGKVNRSKFVRNIVNQHLVNCC